jgi:hypothetical protein
VGEDREAISLLDSATQAMFAICRGLTCIKANAAISVYENNPQQVCHADENDVEILQ